MGALWTLVLIFSVLSLNPTPELVRAEQVQIAVDQHRTISRKILQNDVIVLLNKEYSPDKRTVLFIHGAKDREPLKTVEGLRNLTQDQFNIFMYQYNYQEPFRKLVNGLKEQWQSTRDKYAIRNVNIFVLPYSYGTAIFRAAAIDPANKNLFKSIFLVQFAPVGGGAVDAERWCRPYFNVSLLEIVDKKMRIHLGDINVGIALSPYGAIQRTIYSEEAKRRLYAVIRGSFSIIASNDQVTLQRSSDSRIHAMYLNGLGEQFVTVISNHGDLPNESAALIKVAEVLAIDNNQKQHTDIAIQERSADTLPQLAVMR